MTLKKRLEAAEGVSSAAEKRSADLQKDVDELARLRGELALGIVEDGEAELRRRRLLEVSPGAAAASTGLSLSEMYEKHVQVCDMLHAERRERLRVEAYLNQV